MDDPSYSKDGAVVLNFSETKHADKRHEKKQASRRQRTNFVIGAYIAFFVFIFAIIPVAAFAMWFFILYKYIEK